MPAHPATLPPGFRFHPTDEELIMHYLRKRAAAAPCPVPIIADVDIYKFDPWDLPAKSVFGDREWYFFSPRDRKYPNGVRPNRAAASGYWKATGTDKPIQATAASRTGSMIGVKKALVFYVGRPPKGTKTAWIMHEYRLPDVHLAGGASYRPIKSKGAASMRLDDWVLCRIFQKTSEPSPSTDLPQDDPIPAPAADNTEFMYAPSFPTHEPREPSISDYLEGCPAVSEMFDSLPLAEERPGKAQAPFLAGGGDEASVLQQYMEMEEQDNTIAAAAAAMLHQSKMLLNNASMTAINSFSGQLDGFGQSLLMNQAFFGGQ